MVQKSKLLAVQVVRQEEKASLLAQVLVGRPARGQEAVASTSNLAEWVQLEEQQMHTVELQMAME